MKSVFRPETLFIAMRKIILGFFFFCLLAVFPENSISGDFGIKGGVNMSGLHSATGDFRHFLGYEINWLTMGNLVGFQVGFFTTVDISKNFQFQPELNYSVRGGDASETFLFEEIVYKIKLTYLEVPLLLKYDIPLKGRVKPAILIGPYGSLKLDAKKNTEIWGEKKTASLGNVKNFDFGLLFGLGAEMDMFSGKFILEFRSNWGFNNIMDIPEGFIRLYQEKDSINNFSFAILTGYSF
jgi:outer membrane immunogenic protein